MAFNPVEHISEMVWTNIDAGALFGVPHSSITLPDGRQVAASTMGHPESVTYWMQFNGAFQQVTEDQAFVESLWLNAAYGEPVSGGFQGPLAVILGLQHDYHVTPDALMAAIASTPVLSANLAHYGITIDNVVAYAEGHAPGVVIVGQAAG